MCHRVLPGQLAERRRRTGGAKHERDVWTERIGGPCMKYVVKLGGAALENTELRESCAKAVAELVKDGNQVALVHGGGVQLTKTLKQLGKQSEFIAGLRVTDAETRDTALMVLSGHVNKSLVASLGGHGQAAVGLC